MQDCNAFYINGEWVTPKNRQTRSLVNPADESSYGTISLANEADADDAVAAAKSAFETWQHTPLSERLALIDRVVGLYKSRYHDMVSAITTEMGAPLSLSSDLQAAMGIGHFTATQKAAESFNFEQIQGTTAIRKEPIGVVALITPWNWPMNQVVCKVAPALIAGCTVVLKPSQESPLSATLLAQLFHEAGVPKGVFNLVHGTGSKIGSYLSRHPDVDMVSFTGSTEAGAKVTQAAASTIKRVALELGGKSANIITNDVNLEKVVKAGVNSVFSNSGQTCTAPTRMLVPEHCLEEVIRIARSAGEAAQSQVGHPHSKDTRIGPVANLNQYEKIQQMIATGIDEGATVLCGGLGKPESLPKGYYVKPTIFVNVTNDMAIAREEIFGPVLCIITYTDDDDAIRIANDSPYGLSGYVCCNDLERAQQIARQMRTGMVHINGARPDLQAPFGGYKQSGNGREWGKYGLEDFLEIKSMMGFVQ